MIQVANQMLSDSSPAVLRELCLAMRFEPDDRAIPVLVKLADKYDGTDRWYLEAFGIGATDREQAVLEAWQKGHENKNPANNKGIEWRLKMEPVAIGESASTEIKSQQLITNWWAIGPFAAAGNDALNQNFGPDISPGHIDLKAHYMGPGNKPIAWEQIKTTPGNQENPQWVDFRQFCADRHFPTDNVVGYFATQIVAPQDESARLLIGSDDAAKVWLNGENILTDETTRPCQLGDDNVPIKLKKGPNLLLCKLRQGQGDSAISAAVAVPQPVSFSLDLDAPAVATAPAGASQAEATIFTTKDGQTLPNMAELAKLSGDPKAGDAVFRNPNGANCIRCHQMDDTGGMLGPPLTVIGGKLTKAQLYESILYPSAAIEMGYETWVVKKKNGDVLTGRKVEDTDDHVTLLDADGKYTDIPVDQVDRKVQQKISMMPEGLTQTMTRQDLVNLVEFLSQRK
jgi:putative heme-binding domain-containing protein